MKRFIFLMIFFASLGTVSFADEEIDKYDYSNLVLSITKAGPPVVKDDYIIFTSEYKYRSIGIAFDFEEYKTIHQYQVRKTEDIDGNITNTVMFYVLEKPEKISRISYRVIIDGLWTNDPENPETIYDSSSGILLSELNIPEDTTNRTEYLKDDSIHFVYNGEPGQKIRLAGNFTNWDSWIYELEEKRPGFYELFLHLPEGTWYYNYYSGLNSMPDKTNPEKVYTDDGKTISVIKVE